MKAVLIYAYGGPEELKFEERPDPVPGSGEVLMKVAATSVNPIDIKLRSGQMKDFWPLTFPAILGVDVSGMIQGIAPGVAGFSVGDNVFANAMQTYASLCVVKAADLAKIPSQMDIIDTAALPMVTMTGAQLGELATGGKRRGTVLVTGAVGNVGRSAVFTAKESGWIVIAGVRKTQMEEAKAAGADRVVALDDDMSVKSLEPLDAVADTVSGPTADKLISKVKKGGIFASVLAPPSNAAAHPDVRIETMVVKSAPATLVHMAEAIRAGKLVIPLGQRFALADANKAHLAAERGAVGNFCCLLDEVHRMPNHFLACSSRESCEGTLGISVNFRKRGECHYEGVSINSDVRSSPMRALFRSIDPDPRGTEGIRTHTAFRAGEFLGDRS